MKRKTPAPETLAALGAWLHRAAERFMAYAAARGVTIPVDVKVACGWPRGGGSSRFRCGECYPRSRSAAGINEVSIGPWIEEGIMVLDVLGHELLHAADDCKSGDGHAFSAYCKALGYTRGRHACAHSTETREFIALLDHDLGAYPRA